MRTFCYLTAIVVLSLQMPLFSQDDPRPWERLGLSLTEWKLITDSNMPMSKVESLLKAGIGISEYFEKPWEPLGLSEAKWIAKRRSGLTNYDIEQAVRMANNDTIMQPPSTPNTTFIDFKRPGETRELASALLLPGLQQYRYKAIKRGRVMVSLAAVSVVGTVAWSIGVKQFMPVPLLVILLPDMGWSYVDHKIRLKKKHRQ
jgi:hypothetical protein